MGGARAGILCGFCRTVGRQSQAQVRTSPVACSALIGLVLLRVVVHQKVGDIFRKGGHLL